MVDKRIEKLKNLSISKKELEGLLKKFGFQISGGKGSHIKWTRLPENNVLTIATHKKEVQRYQLKQVIRTLMDAKLLEDKEEIDEK